MAKILHSTAGAVFWVIALAGVTAIALSWVRPQFLNPDTAQHVSVARNLLDGAGFSTSILYYEEQYALGRLPAPQTLWPPGYPLMIAALMSIGMPAVQAAFALAIAGHFAVALLIFCIGSRAGLGRRGSLLTSMAWLSMLAPATLPMTAFTEPVFTAFTLLALLALTRACRASDDCLELRWLWLAGFAAAAAFCVRYIGVAFIGAVGILLLVRFASAPSLRRLREGLAFGIVPVLVCGGILLRNTLLTGGATGGPAVASDTGVVHVIKSLYWASLASLGVFTPGWEYDAVESLVLLVLAITLFLAYRTVRSSPADIPGRSARWVLWVTGLYACLTSLLLIVIALGRSHDLIEWRYVVPLLPFVLLSVGSALQSIWLRDQGRVWRMAVSSCCLVASLLLLVTQRHVFQQWDTRYVNARLARESAMILEERIDGASLQEVLNSGSDAHTPILTQDGQVLGALLTQPVLGMPSPYYTTRVWSEAEAARLVDAYNVGWILFLPKVFHPTGANDRNKVFFAEIARGKIPGWLRLAHRSDQIELYSVDRKLLRQTQVLE